jgi:MATE family multidrug resistance protein
MIENMICSCCRIECWSIELSVFFAAPLGIISLSAQVVVQQIVWLLYMIMASVGDAGNILIGQYLGANKPREAANAKNVTYTLSVIVLTFNVFFILVTHRWLPYLFSIEPDALSLTRYGLLLAAVVNIFDGLNVVQTGIVKAW